MFLQIMATKWSAKFRLCLGPGIDERLEIVPARWSRIKTFDPSPEACRLPANETLYVLKEGAE